MRFPKLSVRMAGQRISYAHTRKIRPISTSTALNMAAQNNHLVNTLQVDLDWNDRIGLQENLSLQQKGWHVDVEWRQTQYGAGLFAMQDISKDTILRTGIFNVNLKAFTSIKDIDEFCKNTDEATKVVEARRNYVKDYLWGFSKHCDENGYPLDMNADLVDNSRRIYAMWIPGNGLNHNVVPNTVYKETEKGIDLVALTDIAVDDELYDDYRRHGSAPKWLKEFAAQHKVTLNFADCNDFVETDNQSSK